VRHSLEQATSRQVSTDQDNELSVKPEAIINSGEFHEPFAIPPGLLSQIEENIIHYHAGLIQENYQSQVNSTTFPDDSDSRTISGSDIESIFDSGLGDGFKHRRAEILFRSCNLDSRFVPGTDYELSHWRS
jgi:hypothetical protein